jgi:hypothetical protein
MGPEQRILPVHRFFHIVLVTPVGGGATRRDCVDAFLLSDFFSQRHFSREGL